MLHIHHAPDADDLVAALAGVLATPLDDVLAVEQVAVHSRGLERWVAQQLAHLLGAGDGDDGACLAIDFPFPARLVGRALAHAMTPAVDPDRDPWQVDRLAWHLLQLVDARPELADGTPLAVHLAAAHDGADGTHAHDPTANASARGPSGAPTRRFGTLRHLADLYDRYAVHRPTMLLRWVQGAAVHADGRTLPSTHAWQADLWHALRDHVVATTGVTSPPERLVQATRRLADDPASTDLPARVALLGLTALPASYLAVLRALAVHREVHLLLLHPSPALWRKALPELARVHATGTPPRRDADPLLALPANPLVRIWGRDAREMQVVLAAAGVTLPAQPVAPRTGGERPPSTLLARLQADVHDDAAPPGPPLDGAPDGRVVLDGDDRSVQVHGCHGPARQVEVLRDVLLHRFAGDPTLAPRDVLVLCPDLTTYAPLLEATFAGDDGADDSRTADDAQVGTRDADDARRLRAHHLRLRIADRTLRAANPLLRVLTDLLALVDDRVSATQLRDLIARPAVRTALDLDDADLDRLQGWLDGTGVRWGLDTDARAQHGVPTAVGTWSHALDRLLVGVCVADQQQHAVSGVVPYDDVVTSDIDLAGRLAELVARVGHHLRALRDPRPIDAWRDALRAALDAITHVDGADRWQRVQVERVLDELVQAATDDAGAVAPVPLHRGELAALLAARLDGGGVGASHRTGDLTVATLVPMRSVPHRVVVLLGMDDGAFPRRAPSDGDDLLEVDPHVGDRDPRAEDRQLLLDALLAARDQLLVLYSARDPRSNEPRPPALPIGELLDVIDRTARTATVAGAGSAPDGTRASAAVLVEHPLHATDPRCFQPGALGTPGVSLGSDPIELAGARARARAGEARPTPFFAAPLDPPDDGGVLTLDDLVRTVTEPVPTLLAERLGLRPERAPEGDDDELPLELRGLASWTVGDRLLRAHLEGADPTRALERERARGALPPGELATKGVHELHGTLAALMAALDEHGLRGAADGPVEVDLPLADGRRLRGAVDEVVGTTIRQVGYARLRERDRMAAWVRLLALSAAHPDVAWRAVTVGRKPSGRRGDGSVCVATLGPLGADAEVRRRTAHDALDRLVAVRDVALTRPVPLAPKTSCAFAATLLELRAAGSRSRRSRTAGAARAWEDGYLTRGEGSGGAYTLVHGGVLSLTALLEEAPLPDELVPPWDQDEPSRFGRWALHVWGPLLAAETLVDR